MNKSRSVQIGGDSVGSVLTIGDKNITNAQLHVQLVKTALPPADSVDPKAELAQLRAVLDEIRTLESAKVGRALDDAKEELERDEPDRDEVGKALTRAIDYAKQGASFAEQAAKLAPHLTGLVAWLGVHWHSLLSVVGLAV